MPCLARSWMKPLITQTLIASSLNGSRLGLRDSFFEQVRCSNGEALVLARIVSAFEIYAREYTQLRRGKS